MTQPQADWILQVKNLTKRFPMVLANDRITFGIRKGEIHCLLGENGAGKSTLCECLFGFYRPDDGEILLKGQPVTISSPRNAVQHGIGMVHQHFSLVGAFTVLENVLLGAQASGVRLQRSAVEQRLAELCELYNVALDLHARIWELSVGEQQWVEILKALYHGVDLLILDEPTAVLTPQESERLFGVLQRMKETGLSIILITHKLDEVKAVSDRVTVLRKGKVVDTVETSSVSKAQLAQMMVGREVVLRVSTPEKPQGRPVLEISGLRAAADMGHEALRGIDLTLHEGEILGIAGVSGNGQRELFEVLVGARKAASGSVRLDGQDITRSSPKDIIARGIGYIPDDRLRVGLLPDLSVAENLILGHHWASQFRVGWLYSFERIKAFAQRCIDNYAIATPSHKHRVRFLSGGNMQKVILARELSQNLRVLLANQPTRGLDVGATEYVLSQLIESREAGVGVLIASEDLEQLLHLSDTLAVICKGQIIGVRRSRDADLSEIGLLMAGVGSCEE